MADRLTPRGQGALLDRLTQRWVRATGQRIDLAEHAWLDGPVGDPARIGTDWIAREATRLGGRVVSEHSAGLLESLRLLAGEDFDPGRLDPKVVDFYERTANWRLEMWSQWSAVAWPAGWALSVLFARRLAQLALPLRPLEVARGIDSRVVQLVDDTGRVLGAVWLRTLRATGQVLYSGWYGTVKLPGRRQPSVRVVFPLPNGNLTVLLRPEVTGQGALRLVSPLGPFGTEGAYLVVRPAGTNRAWARRIPIAERYDVYVDPDGVLRCDHGLRLWQLPVLGLHYRLDYLTAQTG